MAWHRYDWEKPLIALAFEARRGVEPLEVSIPEDQALIEQAFAHCESVTAVHSRSFSLASRLLPWEKRRAVRALYAFCRTTDDIVDHPTGDTQAALEEWREHALRQAMPNDLVSIAWAETRMRYNMPTSYAEQFMDGVARDLHQTRYGNFDELAAYCYGVASTVGLMSMHIIGYQGDRAIPYAVRLGVALQLTNILRDVREDWERGRLYLPQDELDFFGIKERDIRKGVVNDDWRAFFSFQVARARRLYAEAWPGIAMLASEGRLAIAAAADFYSGILDDIQAHGYDVFGRRAHLTAWKKLRRLPSLWWRTRRFNTPPLNSLTSRRRPMPGLD